MHEVVARSFWEVLHWDEIKVATIRAAAQFWDVLGVLCVIFLWLSSPVLSTVRDIWVGMT